MPRWLYKYILFTDLSLEKLNLVRHRLKQRAMFLYRSLGYKISSILRPAWNEKNNYYCRLTKNQVELAPVTCAPKDQNHLD